MNTLGWRTGAIGAQIVDVLVRARAAYDALVALNARHRERDKDGATSAYQASVEAVRELGKELARLQMTVEGEG